MRKEGRSAEDILTELEQGQRREPSVHDGRLFGLVYPSSRPDLEELIAEVTRRYLFGNALNPFKFTELAALERQVIAAVGALVNVPQGGGGTMTSGGTESILMSMLVNRERARARGIDRPQILAPVSAHPAYAKAAHYFGMELVHFPLDSGYRADVLAAAPLVTPATAVVVASAFSYPYGTMDPVSSLATLAAEHGIGCHVDACIGGFVLPFLEQLGRDVPPWDFRVDGVTEISADVHKYGYASKGVSVILYRTHELARKQLFMTTDWLGGFYASTAMAGTRPAGPIAAAWAALMHIGQDGYLELTRTAHDAALSLRAGIESIDGLTVRGDPPGTVMAFGARDPELLDIFAVGEKLSEDGWYLDRQNRPDSLHATVHAGSAATVPYLIDDLRRAVAHVGSARATSRDTTYGQSH